MISKPPFYAQERDNTCSLACLRMLLGYFGRQVPAETELALATAIEAGGIWIQDLRDLAERYELRAEVAELEPSDIYQLVTHGTYPIVFVERLFIDGEDSLHSLIPIAIDEETVFCLDPLKASSVPPGERRITKKLFEQARSRIRFCVICSTQVTPPAPGRAAGRDT
jgi:ABC-type bacteriocin/lantibiotic exporter with double-glycine peptidase domain